MIIVDNNFLGRCLDRTNWRHGNCLQKGIMGRNNRLVAFVAATARLRDAAASTSVTSAMIVGDSNLLWALFFSARPITSIDSISVAVAFCGWMRIQT
jgi:hypothetical protein